MSCFAPVYWTVSFWPQRRQRQPFRARLAPGADLGPRAVVVHRDARPAVGVGAAISRIGDELADAGVARAAPRHPAAGGPGRQVEPVLEEPQQRLAYAAELGDLVDRQPDRRLDPPVGVLFQPTARFDEAHRGGDHELAPPRL